MGMLRESASSHQTANELIVFSAGTVCRDVSAIGNHAGLMGASCRPLAIFLSEIRHVKPHWVFHECTSRFLREVFTEYLDDYDLYTIQRPPMKDTQLSLRNVV